MKKSLILMVVLVSSIALAGTAVAGLDWACMVGCEYPTIKTVCYDTLLGKGEAKGVCPIGCGPCAPVVCYSGKWLCVAKCPAVKKPVVEEKSIVDDVAKGLRLAPPCPPVCGPVMACAPAPVMAKPKAAAAKKPAKK